MSLSRNLILFLALLFVPLHAQAQMTVRYIHTDALGSVVAESSASGTVIERREYEPYGEQLVPALQDGPGYTGHVQDAATGLTYMQQRYYDPQLGVFLSVDPISAYESPVMDFNRYVYARSNPYRFIDPDGRQAASTGSRLIASPSPIIGARGSRDSDDFSRGRSNVGPLGAAGRPVRTDRSGNPIFPSEVFNQSSNSPDLPDTLVGDQDSMAGERGGRHISGGLAGEKGGTGVPEHDYDKLTGSRDRPAGPQDGNLNKPGVRIGENGIIYRPSEGRSGPRIDIPANGDKPHETLHYPKGK